jgi:hypothetical protein
MEAAPVVTVPLVDEVWGSGFLMHLAPFLMVAKIN